MGSGTTHNRSVRSEWQKLLGSLDMNEGGTGEKYQVSYIYCADASDPNDPSENAIYFDEPDDPILQRVTRYLARVEYYPGIPQTWRHQSVRSRTLGIFVHSSA